MESQDFTAPDRSHVVARPGPRAPWRRWLWAVAVAATAAGCSPGEPDRHLVAASIFPLYDIVRRVAGDRLRVELVLPPGQTTHYYDPSPKDAARIADSSIVFAVGLGLDDWLSRIVKSAGSGRGRIFELAPLADPILAPAETLGSEGNSSIDPHIWLDPVRMQRVTDLVVETCRNLDPEEGPGYKTRGEQVKASLMRLHHDLLGRAARWRGRKVVTFHGSLYYFTARYGPEVVAVVEPIPGREPTARQIDALLAVIRRTGATALFSEPQLDASAARTIAGEAKVPLFEIDPVGGFPATDSYEKVLLQIADVLDRALPAPPTEPGA